MPGMLDVGLVLVFAVAWPLLEYFWVWPNHVRAVERGDPDARSRAYSRTILEQWVLAAVVIALTLAHGRSFATLGLRGLEGWRLWLGVALPVAYLLLIVQQSRALAAKPETRARLKTKLEPLRALIPYTSREIRLFIPLSITAGICEELLFRGYLVWVLQSWIGLWPAAIASMGVFGLGHAYQGAKFGIRAFWAGVGMGLLAIATGSIVPGMVLHALIDVGSGWILYSVVRDSDGPSAEPAAMGAV